MNKFEQLVALAAQDVANGKGAINCTYVLAAEGKAYPRTCTRCRLGPCPFYSLAETPPQPAEKPSDPLLMEARKLVARRYEADQMDAIIATLAGDDDGEASIQNCLIALRRGVEIGKEQSA
jgi:hypothetical protein